MYDRTVSVVRVFRGCVSNLFSERFPIDLVLIPLRRLKVIIGMDWLGPNGVVIDFERHLVRVRTASGGEMVIPSERDSYGLALYSVARARRFLQHGCSEFLAYISDTQVDTMSKLSRIPIVWDFLDVFSRGVVKSASREAGCVLYLFDEWFGSDSQGSISPSTS